LKICYFDKKDLRKIMSTWIQYVIPAFLGLLGGVAGSLIAPWVQWGVEKRKLRRQAREKLIQDLREFLGVDTYSFSQFLVSSLYSRLLPYLSKKAKIRIDKAKEGTGIV
jgi:hypothetical protein